MPKCIKVLSLLFVVSALTSESPMISTRDSEVGGVVDNVEIENVPINTRDVQQLALLVPGAKRTNRFDPTKSRVPAISFGNNGSGRGILFMLDGGDNTDDAVGGIVQQVSMDAVQEFAVVTSRIKAEFARAGEGAISIITKSGYQRLPWFRFLVLPGQIIERRDGAPEASG